MSGNAKQKVNKKAVVLQPLLHKTEYNLRAGTQISVALQNGNIYEGQVLCNPMTTREKGIIELINVKNVKIGRIIRDTMMFSSNEIAEVCILKTVEPARRRILEVNLPTFLIASEENLASFLNTVSAERVEEIGVGFHGVGVGRYGLVAWIIFCMENCLVPIDVTAFEVLNVSIWNLLKEPIFENEEIMKVFHDMNPAVDFLFHRQHIDMKNVYDTQLMHRRLNTKDAKGLQELFNGVRSPAKNRISLSAALKTYLQDKIPDSEIVYLTAYDNDPSFNSVQRNPLLDRPTPHRRLLKYMALTVKYLLSLKKQMDWIYDSKKRELFKTQQRMTIERGC